MDTIVIPGERGLAIISKPAMATDRRTFLKLTGASLALLVAGGCHSDSTSTNTNTMSSVDVGSGNTGILNYAYALEQLEGAFYTQVVASMYSGASQAEMTMMADIRDHENAHRLFLKAALGSNAIVDLQVDFSSIDFTNRTKVLTTAKAFEDLGVSAYNGAGRYLTDAGLLTEAGKIVSVEARHASAIRDLLNPKSADFAGDDVVDANGLDMARKPSQVLPIAQAYIKTTVTAKNLA